MAAGTGWGRSGLEEPGDLPARCGEATMGYRIWQESKLKWSPQGLDWMNILMRHLSASKNIMLVI